MFHSAIMTYIRNMLSYVPVWHWVAIGVLSLVITSSFAIGRKIPAYGSIVLCITTFIVLFLLEETVVIRYCDYLHHGSGFDLAAESNRVFNGNVWGWTQIFSNFAAFIPLGFFFSEFLASARWFSARRQLWLATSVGFGLSIVIECLQLLLRVGFFELTDLVMNTLGAFVGAGMSVLLRRILRFVRYNN